MRCLRPCTDGVLPKLPRPCRRIEEVVQEDARCSEEREARALGAHKGKDVNEKNLPSAETTAAALALLLKTARKRRRPKIGDLAPWHEPGIPQQALVIALDAALLAGEDGRMLTTNLVFDALASRWSETYCATVRKGPARVSWEMHPNTLKASLIDLRQRGFKVTRLGVLLDLVQDGCGLYRTEANPMSGHTVKLVDWTMPSVAQLEMRELRREFTDILDGDPAYSRRGSKKRLLLADQDQGDAPVPDPDDEETDADANHKVVCGWKYNVAVPGRNSQDVIDSLQVARLYFDAKTFRAEFEETHKKDGRLVERRHEILERLWSEYKVDVTKSNVRPKRPWTVVDAGTGEKRPGGSLSPRELAMYRALKGCSKDDVAKVKALVEEYDDLDAQIKQVQGVCQQLREIDANSGEIEIRSRYYKVSNRRYQNIDFWPPEVSGKAATHRTKTIAEPRGRFPRISVQSTLRGRLFLADPARPHTLATSPMNRLRPFDGNLDDAMKRTTLVGRDVSASQVQILAAFLGLGELEALFKGKRYWDIVAERAWQRHRDGNDDFKLPQEATEGDRRLDAAFKKAVMTWLYNSSLETVVETLDASRSEYGPGLGSKQNISLLLHDEKLKLREIDERFKPACRLIAQQAWDANPCQGLTFTDPFDGEVFRWNPVRWRLEACAGSGDFKIYAKVPYMEQVILTGWKKDGMAKTRYEWSPAERNANGDYPVDRAKLKIMVAPCLVHMLDAAFAGFVIKKLNDLKVQNVVHIHDAWLVPEDAKPELDKAVAAAGEPWLRCLGPVYADLEHYLGQDTEFGPWVRDLRQQWTKRIADRKWPDFRVGDADLITEVEGIRFRASRVRNN